MENRVSLTIDANSKNESFARACVASFAIQLDPTLEEINDIKMAVSEAVTNAIIHGYDEKGGKIFINLWIIQNMLHIEIIDKGNGIENIKKAMTPLYTSKPHLERSGMGFTVMEAFMDEVLVKSNINEGTTVYMNKKISKN